MQGAVAVEVCFLDVDVHDGPPGIDLLYPGSHVLRERDPIISFLQTSTSSPRAPLTSRVPSGNATVLSSLSIL